MKEICVQLKDEKYKDYYFYLFINQLNVLHSFICYKLNEDTMDYSITDDFSEDEIDEIKNLLYQPHNFIVLNDLHPVQILINRSKKDKIELNYNKFKQSQLFGVYSNYKLLFAGEFFHELFFLVYDRTINQSILLLSESIDGFKIIKNQELINDLTIEEIALIISVIIPRLKEQEQNFIVHLSDNIEIMLYKEDGYGYAFLFDKEHHKHEDKLSNVRYLYFDILSKNKSEVLYQDEFNQQIISKLRTNAKEILSKSKYFK